MKDLWNYIQLWDKIDGIFKSVIDIRNTFKKKSDVLDAIKGTDREQFN